MGFRTSTLTRCFVASPQRYLQQLHALLATVSAAQLAKLCLTSQTFDHDALHAHATLAAFGRRGQMSVEPSLPFLSTLVPAESNAFLEVLLFISWWAIAFAFSKNWWAVTGFAVILMWSWQIGQGGLSISYGLGDAAMVLGLLSGERSLWSEGLVLLGYAFGSTGQEACVAYLVLFERRVAGLMRKIADTNISCVSSLPAM